MCEAAPESMRVKELQAELDERGVSWRGMCVEKQDLVKAVKAARAAPATPSAPVPPPPSPPPEVEVEVMSQDRADAFASSVLAEAEREAAAVNAMSEDEIVAELSALGVEAEEVNKSKLVAALLEARASQRPMFDTSQFGQRGTQW